MLMEFATSVVMEFSRLTCLPDTAHLAVVMRLPAMRLSA